MGRLLVIAILLALVGTFLWMRLRRPGTKGRSQQPPAAPPPSSRPAGRADEMVRCLRCGVHLPAAEAVSVQGRWYCSAAHRDADADRA